MSQQPPGSQPPSERAGGYRRSTGGLTGALIATVLAVLAFVAFRGLTRDNEVPPPRAVDWKISLQAARDHGGLQGLAPTTLPDGWRATSASYTPGDRAAWHLGLLTGDGKYVGIEESRGDLDDLVRKAVDEGAQEQDPVQVGAERWQVFTDAGGDYALGRTVSSPDKPAEAQVVVGSAPDQTIREFVATLR